MRSFIVFGNHNPMASSVFLGNEMDHESLSCSRLFVRAEPGRHLKLATCERDIPDLKPQVIKEICDQGVKTRHARQNICEANLSFHQKVYHIPNQNRGI